MTPTGDLVWRRHGGSLLDPLEPLETLETFLGDDLVTTIITEC